MGEVIVTAVLPTSCCVTFSSSTPTVSAQPFISPDVPFAGELSRKRKKDSSGTYFILKEDMWAKFQKCWSAVSSSSSRPLHSLEDHSGPSSSAAHSAQHGSLARSSSTRPPNPVRPSSAHRPANLCSPARPVTPTRPSLARLPCSPL